MFETVKELIIEQSGTTPELITLEASLVDDLDVDEIDLSELIMALEVEFDIQIPDDAIESTKTVRDILTLIEARI